MKDPVFAGPDVPSAVESAAEALGLLPEQLRFVVLDPGSAGGPGRSPSSARIAVLLGAPAPAPAPKPTPAAAPPATTPARGTAPPMTPEAVQGRLRQLVAELGRAAGLPLEVHFEAKDAQTLVVRLSGSSEFLLAEEGERLQALEHLFQRIAADHIEARLVVDAEGYRQAREIRITQRALALADEVRSSGTPRQTGPLNSYERRLVHVALANEPGVQTFSVGEGASRRVTIAPDEAPKAPQG
jgi:spoIIIJ-associated protein